MRIALFSHRFAPDIGGIETMSELLANYFCREGHEVVVVTHSVARDTVEPERSFPVLRRPTPMQLWRVCREVDVVFHNNICLRFAWPQLMLRRPWVIAVRTWLSRNSGRIGPRDLLKRMVLNHARVIAISTEVANHVAADAVVIPNGYRDEIFRVTNLAERDPRKIIFAGRLVESKGVQTLLRAMSLLGESIELDVVGEGPYRPDLVALANSLGLQDRVRFLGALPAEELAVRLNACGTMVVPSLWNEPFGIVALEGMACGCIVVASEGGGLSEAVGPAGLTFPNGDHHALAAVLANVVAGGAEVVRAKSHIASHLAGHTRSAMASRYLKVIEQAAKRAPVEVAR